MDLCLGKHFDWPNESYEMTLDFENPPINEVAVGLFFQPITALRAEHIGALWGTIRDQFPNSSQNPPLLSPGQTSFSQLTLPGEVFPLPRFWFISADETNLLQLQRDAFFFNWRRRESDYPRFKSVLAQFEEYFSFFVQFARQDLGVTTVTPTALLLVAWNRCRQRRNTQKSCLSSTFRK
jgi:uncharacterized protein (TIGR04255 family)